MLCFLICLHKCKQWTSQRHGRSITWVFLYVHAREPCATSWWDHSIVSPQLCTRRTCNYPAYHVNGGNICLMESSFDLQWGWYVLLRYSRCLSPWKLNSWQECTCPGLLIEHKCNFAHSTYWELVNGRALKHHTVDLAISSLSPLSCLC